MHFEIYLIYYLSITTIFVTIRKTVKLLIRVCVYSMYSVYIDSSLKKMKYDNGVAATGDGSCKSIESFHVEFRSVRLLSLPLVLAFTLILLSVSARTMSDLQTKRIYCAQQINVPLTFPHILKLYAKAAIRTQPHDLLRWTAAYFRALANGEVPPAKVHSFLCKHVVPRQSSSAISFSTRITFPRIHYSSCNMRNFML